MSDSIDPDLRDIESELLRLRPAAVPPRLTRAVADALRPRATSEIEGSAVAGATDLGVRNHRPSPRPRPPLRVPFRPLLAWSFAAGALAAAIVAALVLRPAHPTATLADVNSLTAESVVASTTDDGEVVLSDGTHARRVETAVVDTVTWKDPRTRATVSWSAPSAEVRFIPVSYQ